jgi:hypothetical protein
MSFGVSFTIKATSEARPTQPFQNWSAFTRKFSCPPNFYSLVSIIEIERHRISNPSLPEWLELSYFSAWRSISDLALKDIREVKDQLSVQAILGALAISKGALKLGALISYSDKAEIQEQLNKAIVWSELYR